jgi:uncharacterized membrane protein (UPF0127 family)
MRVRPVPTLVEPRRDRTLPSTRQGVSRRGLLLAAACLALAAPSIRLAALAADELTIETATGAQRFTIELVDTPESRARGLMFRRSMLPDHGMLFDFKTEQPVAFWMKNTPLPLDMLFIDGQGVIVQIAADTTPFSEAAIPSRQPIRAVLEVNAGTAERLEIAVGDRVRHPIFAR